MRSLLPLSLVLLSVQFVCAEEELALVDPRVAARQSLECAKLELRLYLRVEYPREVRHLESAVKLTKAEVNVL